MAVSLWKFKYPFLFAVNDMLHEVEIESTHQNLYNVIVKLYTDDDS